MDSAEVLLRTDDGGARIIPCQAAEMWIDGKWSGHSGVRAVPVRKVQGVQKAFERKGTNGCHMASSSSYWNSKKINLSPPLLCDQSSTHETGTKAKVAQLWANATTAAVGEERL